MVKVSECLQRRLQAKGLRGLIGLMPLPSVSGCGQVAGLLTACTELLYHRRTGRTPGGSEDGINKSPGFARLPGIEKVHGISTFYSDPLNHPQDQLCGTWKPGPVAPFGGRLTVRHAVGGPE